LKDWKEGAMARRRYNPEEIIAKLREAEILLAQGMKVIEVVRELGIHEVTYYRWRKEYGGMRVNQMIRPGFDGGSVTRNMRTWREETVRHDKRIEVPSGVS